MRIASFAVLIIASAPAAAQEGQQLARPNTILVAATGKVETPPDMATITMTIRGEGKTPDAASTALAATQKAIVSGLRGLDPALELRTGSVSIRQHRSGDCNDNDGGMTSLVVADDLDAAADRMDAMADGAPRASKGKPRPCVVDGNIAEIEATASLTRVKEAGTAVGLAGRLGARSARLEEFALRDDGDANARAVAKAVASARTQAAALAAANGSKLGAVVSITSGDTAPRQLPMLLVDAPRDRPAMAMMMQPVAIDVSPKPVETRATVIVAFALQP